MHRLFNITALPSRLKNFRMKDGGAGLVAPRNPVCHRLPGWVIFGVVVLAGAMIFTVENDAPFHRHPDEMGKARQVLTREWNFHHPMLMVWGAERVVKVLREVAGFERDTQSVVVVGRSLVALCSAVGIASLTLLASRVFGCGVGVCVALALLTSGSIFHISHWFKEDPVLVMGWSILMLAMAAYGRRANWKRAVCVGIGCGLAASGKYIGVLGLPVALLFVGIIAAGSPRRRIGHVLATLASAAAVFVVCNIPVFLNLPDFFDGFQREVELVREGHHGVRRTDGLHGMYFYFLSVQVAWWTWPLAAVGIAAGLMAGSGWRERAAHVLFPLVLLGLYLLLVSFSPKIIYRYAYPVSFYLLFLSAVGAAVTAGLIAVRMLPGARNPALPAQCMAGVAFAVIHWFAGDAMGVGLSDKLASYRLDTFQPLHRWMREEMDANAVIYQPDAYHLVDQSHSLFKGIAKPFPQRVISKGKLMDAGSLKSARRAGVTHILARTNYHTRYADDSLKGTEEALDLIRRRGYFFRELHESGRVVFTMDEGPDPSLHPPLTMHEIVAPK